MQKPSSFFFAPCASAQAPSPGIVTITRKLEIAISTVQSSVADGWPRAITPTK
ncbi:hypothetical protein [Mitsuaria sp. TWR114]|uniref:hypothetical protein n=1 Tax=Mitsuaria sp. TWR114 TaxID=2601731 RepID=UPI002103B9F2|nr:hypothetical protein [Mitsuaria sp. TWR114]